MSEKEHNPKVSIYIPSHNYGLYLKEAIESVLKQSYDNWELIIIDDGSTDDTHKVLADFEGNQKIQIHSQEKMGLTKTNNKAVKMALGEYVMRLDADDYLDDNALLVLVNALDSRPDVAMVYPDYYVVSEDGELIRLERRSKVYEEDKMLDHPSHAACAMIRKSCLLELGGYNEDIMCQDGYDLWIRLIQKYNVHNVNLPLFYYRKHYGSMSADTEKILNVRGKIKRAFMEKAGKASPKVLAIIPIRDDFSKDGEPIALRKLAGRPVLDYTIDAAVNSEVLDKIIVVSENTRILEYASRFKGVEIVSRSEKLGTANYPVEPTVTYILDKLKKRENYAPDAVMLLFVTAPLRDSSHIRQAVDTLQTFKCDSVISIFEDGGYFYRRGRYGFEPITKQKKLRIEKEVFHVEREVIYKENNAILLSWTNAVTPQSFTGHKISHILMLPEKSLQLKTEFDLWMAEQVIKKYQAGKKEKVL